MPAGTSRATLRCCSPPVTHGWPTHDALIDDGTVWILTAAGYDDGGCCLPREGEFDVAGLQSVTSLISELAVGTTASTVAGTRLQRRADFLQQARPGGP
jgi:hypothetical protein